MELTPDVLRRRANLRLFIKDYHLHTPGEERYKQILTNDGRDAAEAQMKKAEEILARNAAKARCDVYGNPYELRKTLIVGVSVLCGEINKVLYLPRPYRHHHVLRSKLYNEFVRAKSLFADQQQGFVVQIPDENGVLLPETLRHISRMEAMKIAIDSNQLNNRPHPCEELYSEDVWAHWDSSTPEDVNRDIKVITLETPV